MALLATLAHVAKRITSVSFGSMTGQTETPKSTVIRGRAAMATLAIFFVIALPLALASSPKIFNDGDVSWHIATGEWILAHARIPSAARAASNVHRFRRRA